MKKILVASILGVVVIIIGISRTSQATTITDIFNQIESDFATFDALQEQYLINYPTTGHYFQGIRSPGVYGDFSLDYVPVDGIPETFNSSLKPSDRDEDWADFGFTGDINGEVIAQYEIHEWMGPNGIGYSKFARFGWHGFYYLMADIMVPTEGLPHEKSIDLICTGDMECEPLATYPYPSSSVISLSGIPEGYTPGYMLANATQTDNITIGGFDLSRGGNVSFPYGNLFDEARSSLETNFSGVSYNSFSSLTTETLSGVDIIIISSVQTISGTPIEPLTLDEQTALLEFVQTGGCAILLTDGESFDLANESLIDAFGMDSSGSLAGVDTADVNDPYNSSVTYGPFDPDPIGSFDQNYPGAISNLGPYAVSLAENSIGTALAVIDPGVINEGSGPVIVYSDLGTFRDSNVSGGFFPDNEILFLNTINSCRDYDGDGYTLNDDCDDNDPTINPGAAEVRFDGIDQDCNGYDLTIDVTLANYNTIASLLTVKAISSYGESANLELVGHGPMIWKANKQEWMFDFVGANPGTVTVSGPEGSWTQSVVVE